MEKQAPHYVYHVNLPDCPDWEQFEGPVPDLSIPEHIADDRSWEFKVNSAIQSVGGAHTIRRLAPFSPTQDDPVSGIADDLVTI